MCGTSKGAMMAVFNSETYGDKVDFRRISSAFGKLPGGFEMDTRSCDPSKSLVYGASLYAPDSYYFSQQGLHGLVVHSAAEVRDEMAHIALCSDGGCNRDCNLYWDLDDSNKFVIKANYRE
tara:strand:+ start:304 stop:666 length:363 start_codon:yes stop_codon:yes gene_type:complete